MLGMIALCVALFIVNFVVGLIVIRYTIGEGLGILVGAGFNVAWIYLAVILWPLPLAWWCYELVRLNIK